ncbi:MAG: small-conductance mechanosensitive channel [Candidatus Azotimanducaceae bacterium]|jgi:small-conductance mechanosensitive channel
MNLPFDIAFSALLLALSIGVSQIVRRKLSKLGIDKGAAAERTVYISKVFNLGTAILTALGLCFIWGVDYSSLILFSSSVLAIMGVAFVAQWSLLSNITASVIIFFSYPARIGDTIRIVDGENSIEGKIVDISLFHVLIETANGETVNYPNNLIVQKPMIRRPDHILRKENTKNRLKLPKKHY